MIKVTELRIGNCVNYTLPEVIQEFDDGTAVAVRDKSVVCSGKIQEVNRTGVVIEGNSVHSSFINPIPLTPGILEKCGFEKSTSEDEERTIYGIQVANNTSLYFDQHKDWTRDDEVNWYLSHEWNNNHFKNDFWSKPKYLHQLQNLILALTGEELEIKE